MAENIDSKSWILSGEHHWSWNTPPVARQTQMTAGLKGVDTFVTAAGGRPCSIVGAGGAPALLIGGGADRADADTALDAIEADIEGLHLSAEAVDWEDDMGTSGKYLVVMDFRRVGPRIYGQGSSGNYEAWQRYRLELLELHGGW